MDRTLVAGLATVVVGGLIALQAPINSGLGKATGTCRRPRSRSRSGRCCWSASCWSAGELGNISPGRRTCSWYYLIGGLLGAAYVTTVLVTVRTLGAGGVTAATVAGQLTMSVVIDRLGVLGLEETPITLGRVIGVVLLFAGTVLVMRTKEQPEICLRR